VKIAAQKKITSLRLLLVNLLNQFKVEQMGT